MIHNLNLYFCMSISLFNLVIQNLFTNIKCQGLILYRKLSSSIMLHEELRSLRIITCKIYKITKLIMNIYIINVTNICQWCKHNQFHYLFLLIHQSMSDSNLTHFHQPFDEVLFHYYIHLTITWYHSNSQHIWFTLQLVPWNTLNLYNHMHLTTIFNQ